MAVDPVPYVVHGAKHSADVFRQAFHDSTGGAEGISTPTSFHVRQTGTPSNQVRVRPGGAIVLNTYSGGGGQSYAIRNASETLVDVPASDSTGAQSWYVIARISDPQFAGPAPANPEDGPYLFLECVSQSSTITDPHLKLASVVVPASTATVTNAMITSLREVANPIVGQFTYARPRLMADDDPRQNYCNSRYTGTGGEWWGEYFPGGDGSPSATRQFVPARATHMSVRADWLAIRGVSGKNAHGRYWLEYGDEYRNHTWPGGRQLEFATQQFAFDTTGSQGSYRMNWALMDQVPVPAKLRGKEVQFAFKAGLSDGADTDGVMMNALSGLGLHVVFSMAPVDSDTI